MASSQAQPSGPRHGPRLLLACLTLLCLAIMPAGAQSPGLEQPLPWDARERALIESLGPWPAPTPDLAERRRLNPLAGQPAAIELGQALFKEPRLSANGQIACASCHDPARGFTDGKPTSVGLQAVDRNAPGLADLAGQRWFGWDGGSDSLWAASIRPLLDAREMGSSAPRVHQVLMDTPAYRERLPALLALVPRAKDADRKEHALVTAAMALAAWMETLQSPRTPFDRYRDALLGDPAQRARTLQASGFSAAAERGLRLFLGKGNCSLCHGGPAFSHGEFHDIGIPFLLPSAKAGEPPRVDPGRYRGIERVLADRYNQAGPWSSDPQGPRARLLRQTVLQHRNWGEWKIPSLRQLRGSAPYMHAGSHASLREVVRHYSVLNEERLHLDGEALLKPLNLSAGEEDDLLAFLDSLSTP